MSSHSPSQGISSVGTAADTFPLSYGQRAVWLRHVLAGSGACIQSRMVRLHGALDSEALRRAFRALVDRHAILRTTFHARDDEPVQRVHTQFPAAITSHDAAGWDERELRDRIAEESAHPFDPEHGPLSRLVVFARSARDHLVLLTFHELVADTRSLDVLLSELCLLYGTIREYRPDALPPTARQYHDYVCRQSAMLAGSESERHWSYWQRRLADAPPVLALPITGARPLLQSYNGATCIASLDSKLTSEIRSLAQRLNSTLPLALLTAFQALLSRYTGQEDLVTGIEQFDDQGPWAGMIGCTASLVPLRADLSGDPTFAVALSRVREQAGAAREHGEYPFSLLIERLAPPRLPGCAPLVQTAFSFYRSCPCEMGDLVPILLGVAGAPLRFGDLTLDPVTFRQPCARLDLWLHVAEISGTLVAVFEYNTDLFDAGAIERLAGHFRTLLAGVAADPEQPLSTLPLLTPAEREQVLVTWNGASPDDIVVDRCIHELIADQVERTPDAIAVEQGDARLTYAELERRANQLAHALRRQGVQPEVPVALCVDRSIDQAIALLAIFKAGGAYVPLDPALPADRLALILRDAGAVMLITHHRHRAHVAGYSGRVLELDAPEVMAAIAAESVAPPVSGVTINNLSSMQYTSGSTGTPKGVEKVHKGLSYAAAQLARGNGGMQRVPICFDISLYYAFLGWCAGATAVLIPRELERDPVGLLERLAEERVAVLSLPCVALQQVAEAAQRTGLVLAGLRAVYTVGERLRITPQIIWLFRHMPGCALHYTYGQTETSGITSLVLTGDPGEWPEWPPIGRPQPGVQVYLLDSRQQPVPIGVVGEIYVNCVSMPRGYHNRPDLNAERLISHPFSEVPGARLFRTGDLARYRPDGTIEFVGRVDHQVKFRGYRVEPAEIESLLRMYPAVADAAVVMREDAPGIRRLVAYVVPESAPAPATGDLRAFLSARLPSYMVPAAYVFLDALPLTYNNKVNRLALPVPQPARPDLETPFTAPRTPLEERLAAIWRALLSVDRVGVHDSFFALGGHSLLAMQLIARVRDAFAVEVSIRSFFAQPTISALALALARPEPAPEADSIRPADLLSPSRAAQLLARIETLPEADLDQLLDRLERDHGGN